MSEPTIETIEAKAAGVSLGEAPGAPTEFMYMPAGVHEISAGMVGGPAKLRVKVDRDSAVALQESLLELTASSPQRPFFDFDHEGKAASAWPVEFRWQDGASPGVYVRVEWSAAGREAVTGKSYRSFSPKFLIDSNQLKSVTSVLGAPHNMGGLVNDPAFRQIRPITGKRQNMKQEPNGGNATSDPAAPAQAAAPATPPAATPPQPATVAASATPVVATPANTPATNPAAEPAEVTALRRENAELVEAQRVRVAADADAAIAAAVARGAIPAQANEVQAKWRATLIKDPGSVVLLNGMPGNPAMERQTVQAGRVSVTNADSRRVVQAYHEERSPLAKGLVWAKDLRKRIKDGDISVIEAANSLGTTTGELIVQQSLDLLKWNFPAIAAISTDFRAEAAAFGQVLKTRIRAIPAVSDYSVVTGYGTVGDAVTTDVPVTINKHKYSAITFNANELSGTNRNLLDEQAEPLQYGIGEQIMADLYAVIIPGNYTNFTLQAVAGFARATVVSVGKKLTNRKVPEVGRKLLLNPDYYEKLLNDATVVNLGTYQNREIITDHRLPKIGQFDVIQAPNLPTTNSLAGFAFNMSALAMNARLPNDYSSALPGATGGGTVSVITNPDTGLSVALTQYVNHELGRATARIALMYGFAPGNAAVGERITSA